MFSGTPASAIRVAAVGEGRALLRRAKRNQTERSVSESVFPSRKTDGRYVEIPAMPDQLALSVKGPFIPVEASVQKRTKGIPGTPVELQ